MSYAFMASQLKHIEGQSFTLPRSVQGHEWVGDLAARSPGGTWPRAGAEAICSLATVHNRTTGQDIQSVLKIFRYNLKGRAQRQAFLVKSGLARAYDWLFQCVPYSSFSSSIGGVQVIGHLSKQVGVSYGSRAEDFDRLKGNGAFSGYSFEDRRRLVGHLATAVAVLEAKGFAHGDLSDGNILIGPGPKGGKPVLVLCDFDGFHHSSVGKLPRKKRPLGTEGYIPPFLVDRMKRDSQKADDSVCVVSDRFGLAALACELMVWNAASAQHLQGRYRLLGDHAIEHLKAGTWTIPAAFTSVWPAGFALLSRALAAKRWAQLPSPHEWLRAIGVSASVEGVPFVNRASLRIRALGSRVNEPRLFRINSAAGTFEKMSPALKAVEYRRSNSVLSIKIPAGEVVLSGGIGKGKTRRTGPLEIKVSPEMEIVVAGHAIEFSDSEPPD
jgi:hypothetical protein